MADHAIVVCPATSTTLVALAPAEKAGLIGPKDKFFILKSVGKSIIRNSFTDKTYSVQPAVGSRLNRAFHKSQQQDGNVFVIVSTKKSKAFQALGKMEGLARPETNGSRLRFPIDWVSDFVHVPFADAESIKQRLGSQFSVTASQDGQEIGGWAGKNLSNMLIAAPPQIEEKIRMAQIKAEEKEPQKAITFIRKEGEPKDEIRKEEQQKEEQIRKEETQKEDLHREETPKEESRTEEPQKEDIRREGTPKGNVGEKQQKEEQIQKEEIRKEEPQKEELLRKEETQKEDIRREGTTPKEDTRAEEPQKEETRKEERQYQLTFPEKHQLERFVQYQPAILPHLQSTSTPLGWSHFEADLNELLLKIQEERHP